VKIAVFAGKSARATWFIKKEKASLNFPDWPLLMPFARRLCRAPQS